MTNVVDFGPKVGQLRVKALASTDAKPMEGFVPRKGDGRFFGLNVIGVSSTYPPKVRKWPRRVNPQGVPWRMSLSFLGAPAARRRTRALASTSNDGPRMPRSRQPLSNSRARLRRPWVALNGVRLFPFWSAQDQDRRDWDSRLLVRREFFFFFLPWISRMQSLNSGLS